MIDEPRSTGEHNEHLRARIEYRSYVEGDPRLQPWYAFLGRAGELSERGDTEGLRALGQRVATAYSRTFTQPELVRSVLPEVTWVQDPGIHRVTGHNFHLPVVEYDARDIRTYAALHGGKIAQGYSTQIPAEQLGLPRGSRPISLLSLPAEELDRYFAMPFHQRRRHELMHSVDPNINNRHGFEGLIQTEMAATLGEVTDDNLGNRSIVNVAPGFWLGYLNQNPLTRSVANGATAQRISDHVRKITDIGGTKLNDEIVRDFMLTTGNQPLREAISPSRGGRVNRVFTIEPL